LGITGHPTKGASSVLVINVYTVKPDASPVLDDNDLNFHSLESFVLLCQGEA
jgi:hypothetical protein